MPLPLAEIFPDEDYRFHLTLRKGTMAEFFGHNDDKVLAERAEWLRRAPELYTGFRPEALPLLAEFEEIASVWTEWPKSEGDPTAMQRLLRLGETLEADFLLLREGSPNDYKLAAGVVCFPSAWSPAEKFGLGLEAIHGVVPRLNQSIGASIGIFLQKLRTGAAFERANWGLAATPERNLHPARSLARLTAQTAVGSMWVRVEDQLLARLPKTQGIVFGIRLRIVPLCEIFEDEPLRRGLLRALRTMPEALAAYKGLSEARPTIIAAARA